MALSPTAVHAAPTASAGAEAPRLTGLLNKFATTREPCLVLCAFLFPAHKCTDIWGSQCHPSVPASAQHLPSYQLIKTSSAFVSYMQFFILKQLIDLLVLEVLGTCSVLCLCPGF